MQCGAKPDFRDACTWIANFEKVSYDKFFEGMRDAIDLGYPERVEQVRSAYENLKTPKRATKGSAGYDFYSPITFTLRPGDSIKIPTGIRVHIDDGWWLACFPRSGLGFKYRLQLDNTVGVIDSDYYYSDNEGQIFAKLTNDGVTGRSVTIEEGDAFMQGVFLPYGIALGDDAQNVRNGGFGSTDEKK